MAKNCHSEFFPTIFPKKTDINSEWPKIAILNFFDNFSKKTGMNSEGPKMAILNFSDNFSQLIPVLSEKIQYGHFWPL